MTGTATLDWDDRYLVGLRSIDESHHEFTAAVSALLGAEDAAVAAALGALAQHLEAHFGHEDRLMEKFGFPPRECHADEHGKVLASVREVQALVAAGNFEIGRDIARALADWFPGHVDYMDSALAAWIVKKTSNGAPVVVRRASKTPRADAPDRRDLSL